MFGRLGEGQEPGCLGEDEVNLTTTPRDRTSELMNAVVPLADAAAATGAALAYDLVRVMAFNLYGQGIAFFQSAQTLIAAAQPAEALLSLRGLGLIAARFEQMNDPDGPGLGIAIRIALDGIRDNGPDRQQTEQAHGLIRQAADQGGIIIPGVLPEPTAGELITEAT